MRQRRILAAHAGQRTPEPFGAGFWSTPSIPPGQHNGSALAPASLLHESRAPLGASSA